jgi:hypothetical protein
VLIYTPATNKITSSEQIPSSIGGDWQWADGVVVYDIVYGIPHYSNNVLIYTPATNKITSSEQIPFAIDGGIAGGVVVNNVIYGIPFFSNYVLIYNPGTNKITSSEQIPSAIDGGGHQWLKGVVVNNVIYGIPFFSNYVLIYNPATNKITSSEQIPSAIDHGSYQWAGGVVVDNFVYGIPDSSNYVLIFEPCVTEQATTTTTTPTTSITTFTSTSISSTTTTISSTTTATGTVTSVTTTTTATPTTTATSITSTSLTTTTLTTTTTTRLPPGLDCTADSQCMSNACHTHCCNDQTSSTTDNCSFCDNVDGSCYLPLALASDWNPSTDLTLGWEHTYNKDARSELAGPSLNFTSTSLTNAKGNAADVRFRLLWSTARLATDTFNTGTPPLTGLVTAGEGADPGLVDVDASTGTISALPRRNGNYTVFLIADDRTAGTATKRGLPPQLDQVIVKRLDFTVIGKPDFVVSSYTRVDAASLAPVAPGEAPYIATAKVGTLSCVVGTMYHIAPISPATLVYDYASGGEGAKIRFTIRNPPPGFFIEPSTGEIQGNPQATSATKTFKSTLLAVDPAGQETVLETMTFTIRPKPRFVPVFETKRTAAADDNEYIDPTAPATSSTRQSFVVGTSYKIATFILNATATKVSAGAVDAITYTLSSNAPESFCVQAKSGDISGTFPTAGNYSFDVLAVDLAGATAVVEQLHIVVLDRPVFAITLGAARARSGTEFTDPSSASTTPLFVNQSYRFSPLQLLEQATTVSAGAFGDITYTLDASDGWFVSAQTGEIFGQFGSVGTHTMNLSAVDRAGKRALVEAMTFAVQPRPRFQIAVEAGEQTTIRSDFDGLRPYAKRMNAIANESYKIFPKSLNLVATTVSSGKAADITFTLAAADGWFVSARTGEVFGQFASVGAHTMTLFAVDGGGVQQLIEELHFEVNPRPVFAVGLVAKDSPIMESGNSSNGDGSDLNEKPDAAGYVRSFNGVDGFTDPTNATFVVGGTYRFAAFELDPTTTTVSAGSFEDISFTLSSDAPNALFVQAKTGTVFGQFEAAKLHTFTLLAVDKAGQTTAVEQYGINVQERPEFKLNTVLNERSEVGAEYTDPLLPSSSSAGRYFVAESYKVAPLKIDRNATTVSAGTLDDITYTLSSDAPGSFFVQAATGVIFGNFEAAGTVSFSLLAVDNAGQTVVAEVYSFEVVERGTFNVLEYAHLPHPNETYTDPTTNVENNYAVGETYRFAPLTIKQVEHTPDATSALGFTVEGAPPGFLINPSDGYIQGTPTASAADQPPFAMELFAIDSRNHKALIETITLHIKRKDVDVAINGPNNLPCNNSGIPVDEVLFDSSFTCDCSSTRFTGANCELLIAIPKASTGTDGGNGNTPAVAGGMSGAVIFFFCVGLILFKRREHAIKMRAFDFEAEIARLITAGEIDADDEAASRTPREVKRTHVTMTELIGEGAFGEVWKAVLDETSAGGVPGYMVAVKTSKETKGEGAEEMLREATVMAQVTGHPNLVSLIGVVTSGAPLLLLLSLCENGSLLSVLKKRKQKGPGTGSKRVTLAERMKMALDTARGMEHLTANKFVHRDLAARNVLVDALLQCKIADFGLARGTAGARAGPDTNEDGEEEEYYRSRTGTFPVRWTAPEAMQTMRFTEGSDVWSFGITMIEVFTDGTKPYATMDNAAVISQVQGGYRAPQPKLCPAAMYALMLECWHAKAAGRPTFERLVQQIEAMETITGPTAVDDTAESNGNTATGGASRSAVVANETYASGGVVETEPATPASAIAETSFDAGVDAGDEYLTVASGIGAAAQHLAVSQQSEPDDGENFEC